MLKPIGVLKTASLTDLDLDNWMLSVEFNPEVFMAGYMMTIKNMTREKEDWSCHMKAGEIREYIESLKNNKWRTKGPVSPWIFWKLFGYEGRDALVELATKTGVYK